MFPSALYPRHRSRRLRQSEAVRSLVREAVLSPADLVQPMFVFDGGGADQPIPSMPGQSRRSIASAVAHASECYALGIPAVAVFPKIADAQKSLTAEDAWDDRGLVPRLVQALKAAVPDLLVITDVALDPYSSLGQDGIVVDGQIHNERTIEALVRQAACHARAGVDFVAPSDMMDGRVGRIRAVLDEAGHESTAILAYSAKYASAFYGPFRDALDSAPRGGADKKSYQMDPGNGDEALHEAGQDLAEGADIVMVKPGLPYLDILWRVKQAYQRPTAVYHVSGEYAMIKAAAANGWIDERKVTMESLLAFKRAGADAILTYCAYDAARWLREG